VARAAEIGADVRYPPFHGSRPVRDATCPAMPRQADSRTHAVQPCAKKWRSRILSNSVHGQARCLKCGGSTPRWVVERLACSQALGRI